MIEAGILDRGPTVVNSPIFPIWKDKVKGRIGPILDCGKLNEDLSMQKIQLADIKHFIMLREKTTIAKLI